GANPLQRLELALTERDHLDALGLVEQPEGLRPVWRDLVGDERHRLHAVASSYVLTVARPHASHVKCSLAVARARPGRAAFSATARIVSASAPGSFGGTS